MARINQNTLQQIKGTTNVEYTEELSSSIPVSYTRKGTTPRPHKYPTKANEIAVKEYEDQIGRTKISTRQREKAITMAKREEINKIISKKEKARRNAAKDQLVDSIAEHMLAVDEYTQEHQA